MATTTTLMMAGVVGLLALTLARTRSRQRTREAYGPSVRTASSVLRCGTRKSALAMWQTRWTCAFLTREFPSVRVEIRDGVDVMADKVLNQSLAALVRQEDQKQKGPGLFTKELEEGLESNSYDFVVHSLKDMPTTLPNGLVLAAICEREDPRDCAVFRDPNITRLGDLAPGSVVGTSSVRREALLKRDYPALKVRLIRGNVNTRLAKLDAGEFDAILLAFAGMRRLGFAARVGQVLDPKHFPYGVSQGSLGIECRAKDTAILAKLGKIAHSSSSWRCLCERALLRELEGGCQVPLGVKTRTYMSAEEQVEFLEIECQVLSLDGRLTVSGSRTGPSKHAEQMGVDLARYLRDRAGAKFLIGSGGDANWLAATAASSDPSKIINKPTNRRPITYGNAESPQTR